MLDHEFIEQINRLVDTYGERSFPKERIKLIHAAVIDLDKRWFETLVSHIIGSMRNAPLLPDFRDAAKSERRRRTENVAELSEWSDFEAFNVPPKCYDCNDEGWVVADHKNGKSRREFICHCDAGNFKKGTRWSSTQAQDYTIDPARYPVTKEQVQQFKDQWRYLIAKL